MKIELLPATDTILEGYSGLKSRTPVRSGSFIADSSRVVLKLLESGLRVESILATAEWYQEHQEELSKYEQVSFFLASKTSMENIVGFNLHQGVMAQAPIPIDSPLEDIYHEPIIVLDGLAKAENVGAIVRNATAFGVKAMLLSSDSCHPYNRRAVRVSMGNLFNMKVHQSQNLSHSLAQLKKNGVRVYAFENRPFAQDISSIQFPHASALVIGSEGKGISKNILDVSDQFVRIPIDEHVYALNAACASAVGLYAFSRQNALIAQK